MICSFKHPDSDNCQFKCSGDEIVVLEEACWCPYHLPLDNKGAWSKEEIRVFHERVRVYIQQQSIKSGTDLCGVVFPGGMVFDNVDFGNGYANFRNTTFGAGSVSFDGARFNSGSVQFIGAVFVSGSVSFRDVKFGDCHVNFNEVQFCEGNVCFDGSTFGDGSVIFSSAKFGGGGLSFREVKFGIGDVRFDRVTFCDDDVHFNKADFGEGNVSFSQSKLGKGAFHFNEAKFNGELTFAGATEFLYPVDFSVSKQPEKDWTHVNFSNMVFRDNVTFENRSFLKSADFSGCTFHKAPNFHGCELHEGTSFEGAAFLDKDYTSISYYRRLKVQMDKTMDKEWMGRFFSHEQLCRRNQPGVSKVVSCLSWLYWFTSNYGQSVKRPLAGIVALAVAMVFYLSALGFSTWSDETISTNQPVRLAISYTLEQTVKPFSVWRSRTGYLELYSAWSILGIQFVSIIYSLLQVALLAFFLLAVRWRFRRG